MSPLVLNKNAMKSPCKGPKPNIVENMTRYTDRSPPAPLNFGMKYKPLDVVMKQNNTKGSRKNDAA